jgi:hypothetical protein
MHPVVSHSLKVWGTTLGRDKVGHATPLTTCTKVLMFVRGGYLFGSRTMSRHTARSSTLPATTRGTSPTTRATRTQQPDGTHSRATSRPVGNVHPALACSSAAPNANVQNFSGSDAPFQTSRAPPKRTQRDIKVWHPAGTVDGHRAPAELCGVSEFRLARLGASFRRSTSILYTHPIRALCTRRRNK